MAFRHACGNAFAAASASGYSIRALVAASRAELILSSTIPKISPSVSYERRLWRPIRGPMPYSTASHGPEVLERPTTSEPDSGTEDKPTNASTEATPSTATLPSTLPWYLQVSPPTPTSPHSIRQALPPLPPSSPALLTPLLTHLSLDLGLDDLSLLDLRILEPAPSLGANLLMLLATARSEKHLHVSADRLCRWLRSAHGLRPFADGLLGRNELKLRQKRMAKRARLMSSVGAKAQGEQEGLRTGWVCVNVGVVEGGLLPRTETVEEGFVGFRTPEKGCSVVVQMMTDEKRGVLDLESLWTGIKNRAEGGGKVVGKKEHFKGDGLENPFPEATTVTA